MKWWRPSKQSRQTNFPQLGTAHRWRLSLEILEERCLLSFLPAVNYPVIYNPASSAVGDFNGDGIPDLAVSNGIPGGNSAVSILLGNGDGTFRSAVSYLTGGTSANEIVAGDFRGIGILDLVVTNQGSNTIGILRGNGDGTFQSPVIMTGFSGPVRLTTGFFSGDGNLDFAVTNASGNRVSVLLGNGDGTFRPPANYALPSARAITAADLNGDGNLDLVVTQLNGGNNVMVLLGNGDGTFQLPPITSFAGNPVNVMAGDFNGDGCPDLAVPNHNDNSVSVLLGDCTGHFQPPVMYAVGASGNFPQVALGDFNQDGILDLVVSNYGDSSVSVLLGNGDGTFQRARNFPVGSAPGEVSVADLNGDGWPDLAVNNSGSNNVSILLNDQSWGPAPRSYALEALSQPSPAEGPLHRSGVLDQGLVASVPATFLGDLQPAAGQLPLVIALGTPVLGAAHHETPSPLLTPWQGNRSDSETRTVVHSPVALASVNGAFVTMLLPNRGADSDLERWFDGMDLTA